MCTIFMIISINYEKFVHAHNYWFFWKGQLYDFNTGLFESNLF